MRRASVLIVGLAWMGCAGDGLSEAPAPDLGKADGTDAADHDCRVILRQLSGLSAGVLDVEADLVAGGGRPAVLVSFDQQRFFEIDEVTAKPDALRGYKRFGFAIPVPDGASDARVDIVPFVKHDGGRLFDHNRHPADNENYLAERATGHTIALDEQTCPARLDVWGPLVALRDDTAMFSGDKPAGGWWVTPIHATLLADGKVLVTGWGRRDRVSCVAGGSRKNGVSFILDPDDLTTSSLNVTPIDEQPEHASDVLYCSGFTPMPDGRVLYAGGATYEWLGTPQQLEWGLDYARVFDPTTRSFQRVAAHMTEGPAGSPGVRWYPATTRLPDGRVLVTGGFTQCCDTKFENLSIEAFDPAAFDAGSSPWSSLVTHAQGAPEIGASIRDYPRVFALPAPQLARDVAMIGAAGKVMLFSTAPGDPSGARFTARPNAQRPGNAGATDATVALVSTGELLVVGGTPDQGVAQRADLYDVATDTWRELDTGISRYNASSVLLPDGTTLLVNGDGGTSGDRRQPQLLDPRSGAITTLAPWTNDTNVRGYHSFALLLKDGRVLIGGGTNAQQDIGCERPDLRIYEPPYLAKGARPEIATIAEPLGLTTNGSPLALDYTGGPLAATGGVVLMALGSYTHGSDQNQRYVPLAFDEPSPGTLAIHPPASAAVAPPGDYILYLVSESGVPSIGKHVHLR